MKLPDALLARLEAASRRRRVAKSTLVRAALEKELASPEEPGGLSCYGLAQDLAGSLKGLPKDLSVNPKYMEGFGQ